MDARFRRPEIIDPASLVGSRPAAKYLGARRAPGTKKPPVEPAVSEESF
jgi:hypothetical protein